MTASYSDYKRIDRANRKLEKALSLLEEAKKDCDPALTDKAATIYEIANEAGKVLRDLMDNSYRGAK